jgi:hypothetical protein
MAITPTGITLHIPITDRIRTMVATIMGLHSTGTADIDTTIAIIVITTAIGIKPMHDAESAGSRLASSQQFFYRVWRAQLLQNTSDSSRYFGDADGLAGG